MNDPYYTDEQKRQIYEMALKRQFAELLLRYPSEPFKAAQQIFNTDVQSELGFALYVSNCWPKDPDIPRFQKEFAERHSKRSLTWPRTWGQS